MLKSSLKFHIIILLIFIPNLVFASVKSSKLETINIEITSHLGDKQAFINGDVIRFLINLDVDSYITVIYQTAEGQLVQLLPNQKEKNTLYKAGLFISVPSENVPYKFTIQPPYGKEKVWVFASDKSGNKLSGTVLSNGLKVVTTSIQKIKEKIQGYSIKHYGQSSFILHTVKN
jgi:hypothetical protein